MTIIKNSILLLTACHLSAVEAQLIETFEAPTWRAGIEQVQIMSVDGHHDNALQLTFADDARSTFAIGHVRGQPSWDQAAGLSF